MTMNCSIRLSIFLIAYIMRIVVGRQLFVEMPPLYQQVSAGESVLLPCVVHGKRGDCIWQKDHVLVGMQEEKYERASKRDNDCSLLIKNVALFYDDGIWECQVSASNFTIQDALLSNPSRLLVMVKPRTPRLEYGLEGQEMGPSLTIEEGKNIIVSCVSKYGNPPAFIKWFIGKTQLQPEGKQSNATEVDNMKTWAVHSSVQIFGRKEYHGLRLQCVAEHPTNTAPVITETRVHILYKPEVQLEMIPHTAVPEHLASFLSLKCLADSNPVPNIFWYKDSVLLNDSMKQSRTTVLNGSVLSQELRFEPIQKHDAGLYSCRAQNAMGGSAPASYRLDVQYEPKMKNKNNITMDVEETTLLGSAMEFFECPEYDANPPAQYKWVHLRGNLKDNREYNSGGRRLHLERAMWSDEGEYRCIVYNMINGAKREVVNDIHYVLHVIGPPEIQARPPGDQNSYQESIGWIGEPVHRFKFRFCSRPPPKLVAWQWGSSRIRAGESIHPKYEAPPLESIIENKMMTNCYWAKLEIKNLQKEDARIYTLLVESEKGRDAINTRLTMRDPTEMRVLIAAISIGLLFALVLISACVYGVLKIRHRRYRQEMEEEGSIAADALYGNGASMDRQKSISTSHAKKSNLDSCSQNVYDYSRIAKQTRAMSPEALEVRRAPAVLQPPTIV